MSTGLRWDSVDKKGCIDLGVPRWLFTDNYELARQHGRYFSVSNVVFTKKVITQITTVDCETHDTVVTPLAWPSASVFSEIPFTYKRQRATHDCFWTYEDGTRVRMSGQMGDLLFAIGLDHFPSLEAALQQFPSIYVYSPMCFTVPAIYFFRPSVNHCAQNEVEMAQAADEGFEGGAEGAGETEAGRATEVVDVTTPETPPPPPAYPPPPSALVSSSAFPPLPPSSPAPYMLTPPPRVTAPTPSTISVPTWECEFCGHVLAAKSYRWIDKHKQTCPRKQQQQQQQEEWV